MVLSFCAYCRLGKRVNSFLCFFVFNLLFSMISFICGNAGECSPALFPPAFKFLFPAYSGEGGGKVIGTGMTWLSGFPGTSCGLNFIRSVMTVLLSCRPISCQDADAHNCSDTPAWQRGSRNRTSPWHMQHRMEFSHVQVDSQGNSNVPVGKLITAMLVNEELQELFGN